jgi:hypothetical protein
MAFPAAHPAPQRAAGGQFDLPGGIGFPPPTLKKSFPQALLHSFENKPSKEEWGDGW